MCVIYVCIYCWYIYTHNNNNYRRGHELEREDKGEAGGRRRKDQNNGSTVLMYETLKNKEPKLTSFQELPMCC